MRRRTRSFVLTTGLLVALSATVLAQRGGGFFPRPSAVNPPYNGQFTFTRLTYNTGGALREGFGGFSRGFGGSQSWNHDYPRADMHLPMILDSITAMRPNLNVSNVLSLDDPEIYKNPILYMWEPGYWRITDSEAANLRMYLLKGGFIIFDDFEWDHLDNLEYQFRRALPDAEFVQLDTSHPIFHSFFDMDRINLPHPDRDVPPPTYYGVFENNDPNGRLIALANHNSDIAEYWEWSGEGYFPVDTTNDAYKLGVNWMIYALTH